MFNFDQIGQKIKKLAKVRFIAESIAFILTGIILMFVRYAPGVVLGLLMIFIGPLVAYVGSWLLYGFGEIIDKLCDIEYNTREDEVQSAYVARTPGEKQELLRQEVVELRRKLKKAEDEFEKGLLSEKEYTTWKEFYLNKIAATEKEL